MTSLFLSDSAPDLLVQRSIFQLGIFQFLLRDIRVTFVLEIIFTAY
jgi:hypothetical protein